MSADRDGDSEMLSSSESSPDSEPQTPTGTSRAGQPSNFPTSELSPPGSQEPSGPRFPKPEFLDAPDKSLRLPRMEYMDGTKGEGESAQVGAEGSEVWEEEEQGSSAAREQPGQAWLNNKKADEDFQRAMEYVVDRDFSLSLPIRKFRRSHVPVPPTDRFKFTPVAVSKKAPRLWDRKPMTPFNSRSRSHKVWKRFLASTSKDIGGDSDHIPFLTEINQSEYRNVLRGVKRQCTATCVSVERGRSFLETKWEMEDVGMRQRKYVPRTDIFIPGEEEPCPVPDNEPSQHVADPQCAEDQTELDSAGNHDVVDPPTVAPSENTIDEEIEENSSSDPTDDTTASCQAPVVEDHAKLDEETQPAVNPPTVQVALASDPEDLEFGEPSTLVTPLLDEAENATPLDTVKVEQAVVEAATPLAIASGRRLPRLEGDDEELLSNFLSRAQAKRAAARSAISNKDPESTNWEGLARSPTPRARRVLEDLDKNSPSSPRQVSPSKLRQTPASPSPKPSLPLEEDEGEKREETEEDQQPRAATPWRRSTRRAISKPQRQPPAVPNTIPVRRSNGTEFVFLQRSEEQQLALTTRANTRRNKADAQLPHLVLHAMQAKEFQCASTQGESNISSCSPKKSPRKRIRIVKKVTWNEEQLVQYEGDTYDDGDNNVEINQQETRPPPRPIISQPVKREKLDSGTRRSNNNPKSKPSKQPASTHSHPQPAKSPTVTRKVRKLGLSANRDAITSSISVSTSGSHNNNATLATSATAAASAAKTATKKIASSHPGTPIAKRKKLAPRSPKAIAFKVPDDSAPKIAGSTAAITRSARAAKIGASSLPRKTKV
ncbi:hypothetical protein FQN50_006698 [Emmonsiellopsis sp. PD_5]|nr:hypothetical protein FQN50_006698 [Emmonsiellopsis sp. PD_5]